jgi:hypothetical protein
MSLRGWHAWISVLLVVPVIIVSATAILIAHDKDLGTNGIAVELPGTAVAGAAEYELKSIQLLPDGTTLFGTKYGLFETTPGATATKVAALGEIEVRSFLMVGNAVIAASKAGLWRRDAAEWQLLQPGDFFSLSAAADTIFATGKTELYASTDDGRTFARSPLADQSFVEYSSLHGAPPYTLNKLVMDLHTGKFFFGDRGEWIWIDAVGGVMLFLSISGLVIWRRSEKRKAAQARAAALPAHPTPHAT